MTLLPDWAPNLHPLVVHFPIALWIAAVVADLAAVVFTTAAWADGAASFLYPAGAVSAAAAYLTGTRAAATVLVPGMAFPIVQQHRTWALMTTIGFVLIASVRAWASAKQPRLHGVARTVLLVAALAALVSLVQTGARGGRLVFERGVGVVPPR